MKILDSFHSKTRVKGGTIDSGMYHQPATEDTYYDFRSSLDCVAFRKRALCQRRPETYRHSLEYDSKDSGKRDGQSVI